MADNGWMYNSRVSVTDRSPEWIWKTQMVVKQLARATKGMVRAFCPCNHCQKRHRHGKDEMYKHLSQYGYMPQYNPNVDFN